MHRHLIKVKGFSTSYQVEQAELLGSFPDGTVSPINVKSNYSQEQAQFLLRFQVLNFLELSLLIQALIGVNEIITNKTTPATNTAPSASAGVYFIPKAPTPTSNATYAFIPMPGNLSPIGHVLA